MTDPTTDAAKLLPCPLCRYEQPSLRSGLIFCGMCGLRLSCITDAEAVTRWNTRPQPAPPASVAEARLEAAKTWPPLRVTAAPCRQNGCYYGVQMAAARNTALDDAAELAADFDVDGDERYPNGLAAAIRALKVKET